MGNAWAALRGKAQYGDGERSGLMAALTPYGQAPKRGTKELIQAYKRSPRLRFVTQRIAEDIAAVPVGVYSTGEERTEYADHPALQLFSRPNAELTGNAMREVTQVWLDLKGEAFWIKERNAQGVPVQLYPVPPHWVLDTPGQTQPAFKVSIGSTNWTLPASEVVWFRVPDPENPYGRGTGVGESLADEIDTDEFAAKKAKTYFYNGALPDTLVTIEGNQDQAERIKEHWQNSYRGFWNSFRTAFTSAKVTINRLDTSFKDMELIELRRLIRNIILETYGVPPECLGIVENSNRSTIDAAFFLYARLVLVPRLRRLADCLNSWLLPDFGGDAILEFENPVPEDREFALKAVQSRPTAFTDNEVRELAGLAPADGKDTFGIAIQPYDEPTVTETLAVKSDPLWARMLEGRRKELADSDVRSVLEALRPERLTARLEPVFEEQIREWALKVLNDLGAEARFDLLNPLIPRYLQEMAAGKIRGLVNKTTRSLLRETLTDGVRGGEGTARLAKRVRSVFDDATDARAEVIARTEVVGASNWATHQAHSISGVVDRRRWIATRDDRTRESHAELDGQEVGINDRFTINGKSTLYPGGFGDPAEDINCRCTTSAIIDDPTRSADIAAVWKAFDRGIRPWEWAAASAIRMGFRAQESDVLEALEELS